MQALIHIECKLAYTKNSVQRSAYSVELRKKKIKRKDQNKIVLRI